MNPIATIVGARPQFVKAAPVSRGLARNAIDGGPSEILIHTGQHYDYEMSAVFFRELGLPDPRYHLGVGSDSHGAQTGKMLRLIEDVLDQEGPRVVVVYGDTNSTMAGALAAAKLHIPVAHVEAGLRSFDRRMPEEINRVVTDHLSQLLFCPSEHSAKNLAREGIHDGVQVVGDVMRETFLLHLQRIRSHKHKLFEYGLREKEYLVATIHRPENTDESDRLSEILNGLGLIASEVPVILPAHPRTARALEQHGLLIPEHVRVIAPVPYEEMLTLVLHARAVVTDSGGLQKEACWMSVPCVTVRDTTEWIETVEAGWNELVTSDGTLIKNAALSNRKPMMSGESLYAGPAVTEIVNHLARVT